MLNACGGKKECNMRLLCLLLEHGIDVNAATKVLLCS
jgi:hypothetical protein